MTAPAQPRELADGDRRIVDLVESALVDPNLHTDLRMRLSRELWELLSTTPEQLQAVARREPARTADDAHEEHLPSLLHEVLVDPNLHTDLRMRLHREITEMVRAARERDAAGAPGDRG